MGVRSPRGQLPVQLADAWRGRQVGVARVIRSHWLNGPENHFHPESRFGKQGDWSKSEVAELQGEEMLFMMLKAKVCVHLCCWVGGPRLQTNCRVEKVPQVWPPTQGPAKGAPW